MRTIGCADLSVAGPPARTSVNCSQRLPAPCSGAHVAMEKGSLSRAFPMMISLAFPVAPRPSHGGTGCGSPALHAGTAPCSCAARLTEVCVPT